MSANQNPEQVARDAIDAQLRSAGWAVQARDAIDFHARAGQAVREYSTDSGPADYVLFVDGQPVGVIEAKKETLGQNITIVEEQSADYAAAKLRYIQSTGVPLPFLYEATGVITRFTDQRDPKPRSREVFSFHRPETLRAWLAPSATASNPSQAARSLRARLHDLPALDPAGLRDCQIEAITNLDTSLKEAKPRALVQMATGAGKTFTAITSIYRLLKHARVRRVLFLVDTRNLGEQAEQEFLAFTPTDDNRKFTELYTVARLTSGHVPADAQVCISTIQRMYSILQGRELDASAEDENPAEHSADRRREPLPVAYSEKVPPEFFDLIIIDECHRSIYNLWRQVLDYFDAFLVGLTATPDARTYAFFRQNVVSEYTHEDAVADGVNVQGEIYVIDTEVSQRGGTVFKGLVERREKLTRSKRWSQQDEDEAYSAKKLDRDIVNPSQIRTVVRAFRQKLPEIFPDRTDATGAYEVPKTLIFAKTDSHADDIINIVREEFGEGNAFCKKVTFKSDQDRLDAAGHVIEPGESPKSVLSQFRNGYHPRIAVTVDMIATGTDVKPLECLLFMRDVKSKGYFEQMKGRGTRTLDHDGLRKVSSAAKSAKTHYVIVDAIGVTQSLKTASRPPITRPTVPFKDLAMEVVMGATDADTVSSLAGRLARIERQLTPLQKHTLAEKMGGTALGQLVKNLFHAIDGEAIEQRALALSGQPPGTNPGDANREKAQQQLVAAARAPLTGAVVTAIVAACTANMQTIDHDTQDKLLRAEWDADAQTRAAAFVEDFETFCHEHRDRLDALTIYYAQPQRRREVTLAQIQDVLAALKQHAPRLAPLRVWDAYARLDALPVNARPLTELTALVALLRRACGLDQKLTPWTDTVRRNYRDWILRANAGNPFNAQQAAWLELIRDHVIASLRMEKADLDYAPFDARGGLGRMHELFGEKLEAIIVLFARTGGTVGKSYLIASEPPDVAVFASYLIRLVPSGEIFPAYIAAYFQSSDYWAQIGLNKTGLKTNVNASILGALTIPLPPLAEQKRIVAKIEELFSELEAGEESLRVARRQLGVYRQSLLKQAFEGKLTTKWRTQRPAKLEAWSWHTLEAVADVTGGLTKNAKRDDRPMRIPYLRVANVYANELRLDEIKDIGVTPDEAKKVRLVKGDLLIVEGNGSLDQIGRVALWDGSIPNCGHQNHLIRARCHAMAQPAFVLMFLLSPRGRSLIEKQAASTSGLHTLSVSKVQRLPIPLCSLPEQQEIVRLLDEQFEAIERSEREIDGALRQSEALRQAILKKAFTGRLVPQDPRDEPASALLARLRAERGAAPARARQPRQARSDGSG